MSPSKLQPLYISIYLENHLINIIFLYLFDKTTVYILNLDSDVASASVKSDDIMILEGEKDSKCSIKYIET
jgi:hypothetical protein